MIGNKHFRTWLKGLDPLGRVDKMRDIAKTLSSTGLKGSLIKESLTQLSQRCQVMLFRLTDEDIARHTRKKTVKRLNDNTNDKNNDSLKTYLKKDNVSNSKQPNKSSSKLEQKYKELFGDDPEDTFQNVPSNSINQFVSNTVNVNIFKLSSKSHSATDQIISAKNVSARKSESNNILRIDVSLCNQSSVKSNLSSSTSCDFKESKKPKPKQYSKSKRKLPSVSKDCTEVKTKRRKTNDNCGPQSLNEKENPNTKELWKTLGMESPTDRSESIIKAYPLPATQGPSLENSQNILNRNAVIPPLSAERNSSQLHEAIRINNDGTSSSTDSANSQNEIIDTAPICKVSKKIRTYNKKDTRNINHITIKPVLEESLVSNKDLFCFSENVDSQIYDAGKSKDDIEVISLLNDNIDNTNAVEREDKFVNENQSSEKSKVGTIRVRDIGSLMKSPHPPNNTTVVTSVPDQPSTSRQQSTFVDQPNQTYTIADQFIATYRHYFDELVESKIPKMGELLHLAIADLNRKQERIKRAEQLSSSELIIEEKQRAEKEINDMMKIRGVEFTSLCETILKRFDQKSRRSLFIALFCRLLKHAECIDPANKQYTLEAKNVMHMMLTKTSFKDNLIIDLLNSDFVQFKQQLNDINAFLEMFNDSQNNVGQSLDKQLKLSRTTETLIQPRSHPAENSEPQLLPLKPLPAPPVSNIVTPQIGLHNVPQFKVVSKAQQVRNESRTNHRLVQPRPQTIIANEPQSQQPQISVQNVNKLPHFRLTAGGQIIQIAPNAQLEQNRKKPRILKAVLQTNPQTNETVVLHSSNPQSSPSFNTTPNTSMNNITQFRLGNESTLHRITPQTNRMNLKPQTTVASELQSLLSTTSSQATPLNNTIPQAGLNTTNMTRIRMSPSGQVIRIAHKAQLAPTNERPDVNNTYLPSSSNTLQSRNLPGLVPTPQIASRVSNAQIIRPNLTSVPNNVIRSPAYPHLYTQSSSDSTSNLPINTPPITSAQLKNVGQTNFQNRLPPETYLINIPRTPKRTPIILSRPQLSSSIQSRNVPAPQEPSVPAVQSGTSVTSPIDVQLNEQPQGPVPSSSHCHPFTRRMPISGKMRMLFGNPSSTD